MIIETKRLKLRQWEIGEENDLKKFLGDKRVMYAYNGAFSEEKIHEWLLWNLNLYEKKDYGLWAIELKENNQVVGECGITEQIVEGKTYIEIGYHLCFDYWHNGYMIEAVNAVKNYAFENLEISELVAIIRDTNIASMNVAIRSGMHIKQQFVKVSNEIEMPHYLFSIKK